MVSYEKGWLPQAFKEKKVRSLSLSEFAVHLLSRVKWKNITIGLVLLFSFGYGVLSLAKDVAESLPGIAQKSKEEYLEKELLKYDPVQVTVKKGETAWQIQQRLTPKENDMRHPMGLVEEMQGQEVDWGNLHAGETVIFLKAK